MERRGRVTLYQIQGTISRLSNELQLNDVLEQLEGIWQRIWTDKERGCWFIHEDWSVYSKINKRAGHRLLYHIFHSDEDISKLLICHNCDRRGCINPEHLFSGTDSDNYQDARNKWRTVGINLDSKKELRRFQEAQNYMNLRYTTYELSRRK